MATSTQTTSGSSNKHKAVQSRYSEAAEKPQAGLCCAQPYPKELQKHIPARAFEHNYGCGSPIMSAGLKKGDSVLDLGSGVGIDCFIAAKLVGKTGRVVGLDMTREMLEKAEEFNKDIVKKLKYDIVEFKEGFIENIPLEDNAMDVVVSNCVLNLSPNKEAVFREILRVLKPGGRFIVSDIVSDREVDKEAQDDEKLWADCYTGSLSIRQFIETLENSGFSALRQIEEKSWEKVNGYHFGSITMAAYKLPKSMQGSTVGQYAVYLGPYSKVNDEEGNEFVRFQPIPVDKYTADRLTLSPYSEDYIVIGEAREKPASSCGTSGGCGVSTEQQSGAAASPCCDPGNKAEPCCDNTEPKADGSPCCDPYAEQQPSDCACTASPEAEAQAARSLSAAATVPDTTSSACCDSSSGCGDGGCGTETSAVKQSSAASVDEECCACDTEAKATGTECCGTGCNTCGCD